MVKYLKKNGQLVLVVIATMLMVGQLILTSGVQIPPAELTSKRYYLYWGFMALALAGKSLLPLFMGYYSQRIKQPFNRLGEMLVTYLLAATGVNLIYYFWFDSINIRNTWLIFFPISQGYFTYLFSLVLLYLLGGPATKLLQPLADNRLKGYLALATTGFVLLPTLFGKDIWATQNGNSILWLSYLFFVGYGYQRLQGTKKNGFKISGHLLISLLLLVCSVPLMAFVSTALREDVSTATRFIKPFSLLSMYYTFSLFQLVMLLPDLAATKKDRQTLVSKWVIVVQALVSLPISSYFLRELIRNNEKITGRRWLFEIGKLSLLYVGFAVLLFGVLLLISKSRSYQKGIKLISFNQLSDVVTVALPKFKAFLMRHRRGLVTSLSLVVLTTIQMMLFVVLYTSSKIQGILKELIILFSTRPFVILLNSFIVILFFLLLYLLLNRFWLAYILTVTTDVVITIVQILKLNLREEPILPADLQMLLGIKELLGMVNPFLLGVSFFAIISMLLLSVYLRKQNKKKDQLAISFPKRILAIITILLFFSGSFFVNHKGSVPHNFMRFFQVRPLFHNLPRAVVNNGSLVQFAAMVDMSIMDEPAGYSEAKIKEIMSKYATVSQEINATRDEWPQDQTVIFNLSESFADPLRIPKTAFDKDPIPNIRKLLADNESGLMVSTGYGGGTANVEWGSITGLDISSLSETAPTPYTQIVPQQKEVVAITDLFDVNDAIHTYTAALYNRKEVFEKFGFQRFYHIGSKDELKYTDKIGNNPYISDESSYKEILAVINSAKDKSHFIQLSSMQNHMRYGDYYEKNNFKYSGTSVNDNNVEAIETYAQGLSYTDEAVKDFIAELDKIEKPITLVWYGDHLPSLYNGLDSTIYGLEMHQTEYFIYNNKYSKKRNPLYHAKVVGPNNFPALAMTHSNLKVTPYYALLTKVSEELPVSTTDPEYIGYNNSLNSAQTFISQEGENISFADFTPEQKTLWEDYLLIQYDLTTGAEYAASWAKEQLFLD